MTRIISIANQKGGVGKTITAINLSAALASFGYSVLMIDFDPQGNASRGVGIDVNSLDKTIFECLVQEADINKCMLKVSDGFEVIPSNIKLSSIEAWIQSHFEKEPFYMLRKSISKLTTNYDFIIIDCPPSLGLLSLNALVASTSVIVPVQCEYFAMEAVAAVLGTIKKVQSNYNNELKIDGFLLTMFDPRLGLSTEVALQVRGCFKDNTFMTSIPRNVSLSEAAAKGVPVIGFKPTSQGSIAYLNVAKEVLDNGEEKI